MQHNTCLIRCFAISRVGLHLIVEAIRSAFHLVERVAVLRLRLSRLERAPKMQMIGVLELSPPARMASSASYYANFNV